MTENPLEPSRVLANDDGTSRTFSTVRAWMFVGLFCSVSCGGDEAGGPKPTVAVRDSAGVQLATITGEEATLPEWRLGSVLVAVEGNPQSAGPDLSFVVEAAWLSDGRIVVPDLVAGEIYLYDASGIYQDRLGGRGDGPGEFRRMGPLVVGPGDTIFVSDVGDPDGGSVQVYHPDVGFLRSVRLAALPETRFRLRSWYWGFETYVSLLEERGSPAPSGLRFRDAAWSRWPTSAILNLEKRGVAVTTPIRFPGSYWAFAEGRGDVRLPFAHRPLVAIGHSRLLYGSGARFELHEVDRSFALRRIIQWPSLLTPLAEAEVERTRAEWVSARERASGVSPDFADVMFAQELLPEMRPAVGRALFDGDGRIWVARFEPSAFIETLWYILEPTGAPLAKLKIPVEKKALLAQAKRDRVLLITRDALDVPRIEVVRIRGMTSS